MWKNFKIFEIHKKKNKLLKMNKFILKRLQMFYIFWTDVLKWQYIKCWAKRLCTYFYEDSSLKLKKNISTMRLTQKNTMLIKNRIYFLLHQHVQIFWYGGMLTNIAKQEYANVHHWEVDLLSLFDETRRSLRLVRTKPGITYRLCKVNKDIYSNYPRMQPILFSIMLLNKSEKSLVIILKPLTTKE